MKIDETLTLSYEYSEPKSVMKDLAKRQIERLAPDFNRVRIAIALKIAHRRVAH